MAIKILGNTIIDDDQNINCSGTAKFKVTTGNGVEVQTIGGNEATKFPFIGKNTSGTTTFSVDGDGNVAANTFIGDGSNLTGISGFSGSYNDLSNKPEIPDSSQFLRSDADDTITKGSTWTLNQNISDWAFKFSNGNGTNANIYMCHGTHGMHIRNDSATTSTYLLDVYAANGNRFQVRGADAYTTINGHQVWHAGNDGAGSGLDADLLDGIDSSRFLRSDADDNTTGKLLIGGTYGNNAYDSVSSTRLLFGGGNDPNNYFIGTNLENYNGTYTKLDLRWHTGIRIGAQPSYGGTRIYNSEDLTTLLFSVGRGDGHTRVESGNLYVQGNLAWHQGNDGSGSGLDADLLDGQQGSYYSNYNNLTNKPSLATLGFTGATNANYITHTSQLTNNSGFLTSIPSTVVQYNPYGNVNISGIIQGKSFRCRAGENGAVQNTFNIEWSPGRHGRLWIGPSDVGQLYLSSDYRLKRNITPMSDGALDRIKMISPVSYQWNDFEKDGVELSTKSEEINEGFIAHELQQIIPSAVDGEKDDPVTIQSLKPDAIIAVAVKAIQELSAKNDALEARIAQLESN
jgi:hypothetical protein